MSPAENEGSRSALTGPAACKPNNNPNASLDQGTDENRDWTTVRGLRTRRAASQRLPYLPGCVHRDPLDHLAASACNDSSRYTAAPGSRRAVLRLAAELHWQEWEAERLVGELTARERLALAGGNR